MKLTATRREAIQSFAAFISASPLFAQLDPERDQSRVKALRDIETTFDFEPLAPEATLRSPR